MSLESFLEWEHIFPNSLEKIWCWIQFFKENWHAYEKTIYPIKLVFLSYTNQNRLFQYFLEWQFANAIFYFFDKKYNKHCRQISGAVTFNRRHSFVSQTLPFQNVERKVIPQQKGGGDTSRCFTLRWVEFKWAEVWRCDVSRKASQLRAICSR